MKRICFITTIPITLTSFVLDFTEYLHECGEFDITFICDRDDAFAARLPEYINYIPIPMKRGVSPGGFAAVIKMVRIFKKRKFDLVQYATPNASLYASAAAKLAGVPVRLYTQWGIRYMGFEGLARRLFKALEKYVCRNSTAIEPESFNIYRFAVSEGLYHENKGEVVWNGSACGVDPVKFDIGRKDEWRREIRSKYGIGADDLVFGFAARLTRDKGINELLEAFRQADLPGAKLLVMGGMDNESSIRKDLLDWTKDDSRVILAGRVDDINRHYAALDVFISPSYREGFGLVLIEAQAMGLPVIATDVPGQIDAFIPNTTGLPVPVKNSQAISEAMKQLAGDKELRLKMGSAAREYAVGSYEQKELFRRLREKREHLIKENRNA